MTKEPFSVSMCVYGEDDPAWFETAVNSILEQTCPPAEVVVVVDGPVPPALDAVITRFEQMPVFRIIRSPQNEGHGNARRRGLAHCTHDLVALMDADDISAPTRFERQLEMFDEKIQAVGGMITEFVGDPSNMVGTREVPCEDAEIKAYMKKRCPMNQVTVMFRKSAVEAVGGYIDWYCEEDYYLWVRMALAGMHFANVPEVLVNVRVGEDMYRRRGGWRYFKSEAKMQRYMRKNRLIGFCTYLSNLTKRFIVQVLLPNRLRGWVFRKFARSNTNGKKV